MIGEITGVSLMGMVIDDMNSEDKPYKVRAYDHYGNVNTFIGKMDTRTESFSGATEARARINAALEEENGLFRTQRVEIYKETQVAEALVTRGLGAWEY